MFGLQEVKRHDQENARATGRIDNAQELQSVAIGLPRFQFCRFSSPDDFLIVRYVGALSGMMAQDAVEDFSQVRAQGFGHDEARDVIRSIDDSITLAPPTGSTDLIWLFLFTTRDGLKPLHISNGLFEDVAQNGDGYLGGLSAAAGNGFTGRRPRSSALAANSQACPWASRSTQASDVEGNPMAMPRATLTQTELTRYLKAYRWSGPRSAATARS